jgi:D-methionine transport system substrate-binding protein
MKIIPSLLIALLCLTLFACGSESPNTLKVGTISGPETQLMEVAKKVAKEQYGLTIEIKEFTDYNIPNIALNDGSIDANVYQHLPYLQEAINAHGYQLEPIGKTFIYPTGIYSHKLKSLAALKQGATVAIPNDPSNETRALLLLQKAGLIKVSDKRSLTPKDIFENPKKLQFKELDAAQLTRVLTDVDIAVINTNYAIPAGLNPKKNALFIESKDSPYANLIVAHKDSKKKKQLQKLVNALHSKEVKNKAKALFGDYAIPAF